jgi:hypothetical protein
MEKEEKCIGDMYLAAAFLSYNICLSSIDRAVPRRQKFTFVRTEPLKIYTLHSGVVLAVQNATLDDIETNFASETLLFPPSYPDAIRRIKSTIHSDSSSLGSNYDKE